MTRTGPFPDEPPATALARALTDSARIVHGPRSVDATVGAVVEAALAALPAFQHVGVALARRDGSVATEAASGDLVRELDGLLS